MKALAEFGKRLTSRKFLLALGTVISGVAVGQWDVVIASVVSYAAAEGIIDAAGAYKSVDKLNAVLDHTSDHLDEVEKALVAEHRALERAHTEV